jgi:hypothetical protein
VIKTTKLKEKNLLPYLPTYGRCLSWKARFVLPLFRAIEIEKVSPVINIASVDTRFG